MCNDTNETDSNHVRDFTATGFGDSGSSRMAQAHAEYPDLQALKFSVCVRASYDPSTGKICFTFPIYGQVCIKSPVPIPVGATLKACAETCGPLIPTGLKVSIYLNGNRIWSGVVYGDC